MARSRFSASARPPDFGGRYLGQVAVVTGASTGLGAQLCRDLARAGATGRHPGGHAGHGRARARHDRQHLLGRRGRLPSPGPGAYPSSEAALSDFSESVSFRLCPKGVRVHVVYPAFMATELGLEALGRGLRRLPRMTIRSVETVSRRILARAGGPSLEIGVSGLIDAAMVFRPLMPNTYHRLRRSW